MVILVNLFYIISSLPVFILSGWGLFGLIIAIYFNSDVVVFSLRSQTVREIYIPYGITFISLLLFNLVIRIFNINVPI